MNFVGVDRRCILGFWPNFFNIYCFACSCTIKYLKDDSLEHILKVVSQPKLVVVSAKGNKILER